MKLHYSTEGAANSRFRKIKSVVNALKIQLEEVAHETTADLSKLSVFNTLPLLETSEGTFFSSNTIVRYLASISENKLYGSNLHNRALVDQWLDITTCDLEAAVAAVNIAKDGREVDTDKVVEDVNKFLGFVENHLNGKKFLVGDELSIADLSLATSISVLLTSVYGEEDRKTRYPHLTTWYLSLVETDATVGSKDLPKESHKAFKPKPKKEDKKKEETKAETKAPVKTAQEEEDDLFGDDPAPAKKPEAAKPKPEAKK